MALITNLDWDAIVSQQKALRRERLLPGLYESQSKLEYALYTAQGSQRQTILIMLDRIQGEIDALVDDEEDAE